MGRVQVPKISLCVVFKASKFVTMVSVQVPKISQWVVFKASKWVTMVSVHAPKISLLVVSKASKFVTMVSDRAIMLPLRMKHSFCSNDECPITLVVPSKQIGTWVEVQTLCKPAWWLLHIKYFDQSGIWFCSGEGLGGRLDYKTLWYN